MVTFEKQCLHGCIHPPFRGVTSTVCTVQSCKSYTGLKIWLHQGTYGRRRYITCHVYAGMPACGSCCVGQRGTVWYCFQVGKSLLASSMSGMSKQGPAAYVCCELAESQYTLAGLLRFMLVCVRFVFRQAGVGLLFIVLPSLCRRKLKKKKRR